MDARGSTLTNIRQDVTCSVCVDAFIARFGFDPRQELLPFVR